MNKYEKSYNFYDKIHTDLVDIDFYVSYFKRNHRILDVGCGTGRIGIELAKRNFYSVGIDFSDEMLNIYHKKIDNLSIFEKNNVSIFNCDMKKFDIDFLHKKKFDSIIFPANVFQVLLTNNDRVECLSNAKKVLKQGGTLIIQMFDPNLDYLKVGTKTKSKSFKYGDYDIFRETEIMKHKEKEQIIEFKYEFKNNEKLLMKEKFTLSYLFKEQAESLFLSCGFKIIDIFSDYDKSKDFYKKKNLIFVLKT